LQIQFDHVAASIPDNAQVIMMFGEIDCREGIVVSVDKGRYKDLEEGVNATVNIYMKVTALHFATYVVRTGSIVINQD
jgi:hypothetical protein